VSALGGSFRALRHRNFRLFLGGQLLSLSGTWMQRVALGWLVYRLTESDGVKSDGVRAMGSGLRMERWGQVSEW
jgi:hypothetical protein